MYQDDRDLIPISEYSDGKVIGITKKKKRMLNRFAPKRHRVGWNYSPLGVTKKKSHKWGFGIDDEIR